MEKYSETEINQRKQREEFINQRWSELHALEKECGNRALRYLLLTNSGGAIAILGFLGTSKIAIEMMGVKIALVLFVLGILLIGASMGKQYHHVSRLFTAWKKNVHTYFQDEMEYQSLLDKDDKIAVEDIWDFAIPYSSLACFICGCIAGAISLF